jgi:hypothetical protein
MLEHCRPFSKGLGYRWGALGTNSYEPGGLPPTTRGGLLGAVSLLRLLFQSLAWNAIGEDIGA